MVSRKYCLNKERFYCAKLQFMKNFAGFNFVPWSEFDLIQITLKV